MCINLIPPLNSNLSRNNLANSSKHNEQFLKDRLKDTHSYCLFFIKFYYNWTKRQRKAALLIRIV
jgi:hypothetical protein